MISPHTDDLLLSACALGWKMEQQSWFMAVKICIQITTRDRSVLELVDLIPGNAALPALRKKE